MLIIKIKRRLIAAIGLLLIRSLAIAAPSVFDNTISWPDDGWYQVQQVNDDGIFEVCAGGRSCEVSQGEYIVINHDTGQRFTDIFVTGTSSTDSVTVLGNTISWPSTGWFQVLNSATYTEICNGTRSCEVVPGSYIVINHSTGERFENIVVGQVINQESAITVTGNTISWTNDGWYQVQSAGTFASICNGGTSCVVPNGEYVVINHDTGRRWDNVIVGEASSSVTRVDFDITVPAYVSNALQVRLVWGDIDTTAMWNSDELWTASAGFPVNTSNQLVVTYSDNNGAITLGSFETTFTTSVNPSEFIQIAADEFDTDRWDSDGDGVSNLSELIAGTNPLGGEGLEPPQAALEFVADKTFRISWQSANSAQFYRVLENPDGISGFTDISGELDAATTNFDHRVALYARVNAQYLVQSCNDQRCVDSDVLMVTGSLANAISYFKASNTDSSDFFGRAVSLSADGDTLAVAATGEDSGAPGVNVYQGNINVNGNIISWPGRAWHQVQDESDYSSVCEGRSSCVVEPGIYTLINLSTSERFTGIEVGSNPPEPENYPGGTADSGAVYVFVRSGEQWQQQAYIKASNPQSNESFGSSVSLSADGDTLVVGSPNEDGAATGINGDQSDNSVESSGAVYAFVRSGAQWQQQAYIKASTTGTRDWFGQSLKLSADGDTLAVGASGEDSVATGINGEQSDKSELRAGAVYIFVRSGEQWQQQAYIKASNTSSFDLFGIDISLSADGNTLAVAATGEDSGATGINGDQSNNTRSDAGAVYVFVRSGGQWQQQAYIKASNTDEDDFFGSSLSLSAEGDTLAVGAGGESGGTTGINGDQSDNSAEAAGAVYIFVRSGEQWQQQAFIKASNTETYDRFGWFSISLSADGNTLAVGAPFEDSGASGINGDQGDNSAAGAGAVYVYVRNGEQWQQQTYIKASNTDESDRFGSSVSLSEDGDALAVGATEESSGATGIDGDQSDNLADHSGAVYLF